MGLAILENISHSDNGIASLWSLFAELVESFLDSWDVLIWDVLTFSGIYEDIAHLSIRVCDVLIDWLNISDDSSVLSDTS